MRPCLSFLRVLVPLLALSACVDSRWREGIACSPEATCPGSFVCCAGVCRAGCEAGPDAAADAGDDAAMRPQPSTLCPTSAPALCSPCAIGCACTCGGRAGICCLLPTLQSACLDGCPGPRPAR